MGITSGMDVRDMVESLRRKDLQDSSGDTRVQPLSDDTGLSVEEAVRRAAMSAVVDAFKGRSHLSGMSRADARRVEMARLFDEKIPPRDRRRAAWFLAQDVNSVELELWSSLLGDPEFPPYLKATVVEALGRCGHPESKAVVLKALAHEDEMVVRGAIKGLSALGGKDAVKILSDLMYSSQSSELVRSEAVRGLGQIKDPQAMEVLMEAYGSPTFAADVEFRGEIISAVGQRESPEETIGFLRNIMEDDTVDGSLRVAAIAALEDYPGEVGPLVLKYLSAEDSEIREEAAWVLAVAEQPGDLSTQIQQLLAQEPEAAVRRRLYQALANQQDVDMLAVRMQVEQEIDPQARMSGYGVVLQNLNSIEDAGIRQWANEVVIPELCDVIMTANTVGARLEAVIALQKAGTPEADAALQGIAMVTTDQQVLDAIGRKAN